MKEVAVFLLFISITCSTIKDTYGFKLRGHLNISKLFNKIFLKGAGRIKPNKLPDMTYNDYPKSRFPGVNAHVSRRFLKDILYGRRKLIILDNEDVAIVDNADYDSIDIVNSVRRIGARKSRSNNILNLVDEGKDRRRFLKNILSDERKIQIFSNEDSSKPRYTSLEDTENHFRRALSGKKADISKLVEEDRNSILLKKQQARKLEEIRGFLSWHYPATDYIYSEINRIKRTRLVKDQLRYMIEYLSQPYKDELRNSIFKCLKERRKIDVSHQDIWKQRLTNTLIIHPVRDPYEPQLPYVL